MKDTLAVTIPSIYIFFFLRVYPTDILTLQQKIENKWLSIGECILFYYGIQHSYKKE